MPLVQLNINWFKGIILYYYFIIYFYIFVLFNKNVRQDSYYWIKSTWKKAMGIQKITQIPTKAYSSDMTKNTISDIQCKYGYIIQSLPLIHILLNVETIWEEVKSIHSYHETFSKWFYLGTFILHFFACTIYIVHIQIYELVHQCQICNPNFFFFIAPYYILCVCTISGFSFLLLHFLWEI